MMRLAISENVLDLCQYFLPRLMFLNTKYAPQLHWGDIVRVLSQFEKNEIDLSSSEFWDKWMSMFSSIADEYYNLSISTNNSQSKYRYLKSAAASYHWAEFMYFSNVSIKTSLRQAVKDCFWKSINEDNMKIISGSMLRLNLSIPYYLLIPVGVELNKPLSCVILSNGLDSITEVEIMSFAELFLDQGMAVLLFDGPGQGINLGTSPLCFEMETVVDDLLNHVSKEQHLIWGKLGFFGVSFGGYFALRVAQNLGSKFTLVINYSGGPKLNKFSNMKRRLKADFQYAIGENDEVKIQNIFNNYALKLEVSSVKIISIHGELDDIFPIESLIEMDNLLKDQHELIVYQNEAHVCLNYLNTISVMIAEKFYESLIKN